MFEPSGAERAQRAANSIVGRAQDVIAERGPVVEEAVADIEHDVRGAIRQIQEQVEHLQSEARSDLEHVLDDRTVEQERAIAVAFVAAGLALLAFGLLAVLVRTRRKRQAAKKKRRTSRANRTTGTNKASSSAG